MTINIQGRLTDLTTPQVMGILNVTPDSFFDGGDYMKVDDALKHVEQMLYDGATFIDIGGMSTRPGAEVISGEEELKRIIAAVQQIATHFPGAIISVDTIRAEVAKQALQAGAHIINDVSGGRFDAQMLPVVAAARVPFVIMHMQGMPADMQVNPHYENVLTEVTAFLAERITACRQAGISDIIIDPGFGFGKTVEHNYTLLRNMRYLQQLNLPILAGVSRKSMICKVLGVNPGKALNGTTAVNMLALMNGANILRVHDVKEATETIKIFEAYKRQK